MTLSTANWYFASWLSLLLFQPHTLHVSIRKHTAPITPSSILLVCHAEVMLLYTNRPPAYITSYWRCECKQIESPSGCVVLGVVPQWVVPMTVWCKSALWLNWINRFSEHVMLHLQFNLVTRRWVLFIFHSLSLAHMGRVPRTQPIVQWTVCSSSSLTDWNGQFVSNDTSKSRQLLAAEVNILSARMRLLLQGGEAWCT